jgi:hypothetical protein
MRHIQKKHSDYYEDYFYSIPSIVCSPEYYGLYPSKPNSIELVKKINDYILVGIKINSTNNLLVSSFYPVDKDKVAARIRKNRLKPYNP